MLENFNAFAKLANLDFEIPLPHILLPIALSFVTFQQIAFLYDCYKRAKGEISENLSINFIDYALFISFFPQLIAGPIVHHREMMPQFSAFGNSSLTPSLRELEKSTLDRLPALSRADFPTQPTNLAQDTRIASDFTPPQNAQNSANSSQNSQISVNLNENSRENSQTSPQTINYEFLAKGLFIFSIGLFKKVFIADSFAKWADAGFGVVQKGEFLNIAEAWATSLSYTFQLYFDFSGYCDMAIGLGLMFGIILPLNFNSPYKSRNIAEFWRRWHITLGRFLKECLYIPLGGNRVGKVLNLRNLFIVAFLSGVWHGAGWGFVIWGVLHGVAMLMHRIYSWFVSSLQDSAIFRHSEGVSPKNPQNLTMDSSLSAKAQNDGIMAKYLKFTQSKLYSALCWLITFNFVNLAWIFFRAENLQGALNLLKSMFGVVWVELPQKAHRMPETLAQIGGRNDTIFYILIAILVCVLGKNSVQITQTPLTLAKALFAAALACASLYTLNLIERTSEFLYFNF